MYIYSLHIYNLFSFLFIIDETAKNTDNSNQIIESLKKKKRETKKTTTNEYPVILYLLQNFNIY